MNINRCDYINADLFISRLIIKYHFSPLLELHICFQLHNINCYFSIPGSSIYCPSKYVKV